MKGRKGLASARRKSQRWMDAKKDSREDGKNDGWEEDRGQTAPGGGPFVVFGMVLGDTVFYIDSDNASNKMS